jgi:ferrochelatase
MKHGLLLVNIGTPAAPTKRAVWRYLSEFLRDPRVITLPSLLRYLLLYCFILPFRTRRSTMAYQAIWTAEGSPMLCHGFKFAAKLQQKLPAGYHVALGMRYGNPSIQEALDSLKDCERITVLPLYPQYSSAANGSSIEKVLQLLAKEINIPSLTVIREFYTHPSFIAAEAELIKPYIAEHDHILFSYHGIPEDHLHQSGCKTICTDQCPVGWEKNCYRAQCQRTTSLIATQLQLDKAQYSTAFQSRLGKTEWIKPYTDKVLSDLLRRGIKRIAVVCPSFVADCLETLEEIAIRLQEQWLAMGGEVLTLVPCLNENDRWVDAVVDMVRT